jgi:hypothetical protein
MGCGNVRPGKPGYRQLRILPTTRQVLLVPERASYSSCLRLLAQEFFLPVTLSTCATRCS